MSAKENKLGTMPINKLILNMSLPMMISMLIQALYNVVDSIFVAQISENALTAVSLAFPVQNVMVAIAVGTANGVNSLIARSLGEKRQEFADNTAAHGIFLSIVSYIIVSLISLVIIKPFFALQTDITEIVNYGIDYLLIVCSLSFGVFVEIMFQKIFQSSGKVMLSMVSQGSGAIINIILDPIMIFGYFGCPAMGVKGAALATVFGQIGAMFIAIFIHIKFNKDIKINFKKFKLDFNILKLVYAVGAPSTVMQSIQSFMIFGVNKILLGFTSTATAVFGVYFKLQSMAFMPIFGLNCGIVPIIGYNYGAGNRPRMMKTVKSSIVLAVGYAFICLASAQIFPGPILKAFNATDNMLSIGIPALRILSLILLPAALCITLGSLFQAVGKGLPTMITSFTRQLIVLLPVAYLLSLTKNLNLVWLAFPIAEVFSVCLLFILFKKLKKDVIEKM